MNRNSKVAMAVTALVAILILAFVLMGPQTQPANTTATPNAEAQADVQTSNP